MQPPFDNALKDIADNMGIALYQRFDLNEASLFLRCPMPDLERLADQGRIEHIRVSKTQVEFFGYQLLQHLLASIQGQTKPPAPAPSNQSDRILRTQEVTEMTGLSRTSIWRLERAGKFPARVPLSAGSVGWRLSDVSEWIRMR